MSLHAYLGFHLHQFAKMKDVQIVAVCDVDQSQREKTTKIIGSSPRMVETYSGQR